MSLKGKNVVVTGASRGIGRAIATAFAGAGVNVAAVATNAQLLEETCAAAREKGVTALPVTLDVADPNAVEAAFDRIRETMGSIDILVNNAGITRDNILLRLKDEDWDRVLQVNLKGAFNCTRSAVRFMMKQRWGRIVNISSVSGIIGNFGQANYAAAKAGMIALTKTTAREFASRGITANAIAPGFITTDMTSGLDDAMKAKVMETIPLKRFGDPAEIASAVLFLSGDEAAYITGQTIVVDGGMTM